MVWNALVIVGCNSFVRIIIQCLNQLMLLFCWKVQIYMVFWFFFITQNRMISRMTFCIQKALFIFLYILYLFFLFYYKVFKWVLAFSLCCLDAVAYWAYLTLGSFLLRTQKWFQVHFVFYGLWVVYVRENVAFLKMGWFAVFHIWR